MLLLRLKIFPLRHGYWYSPVVAENIRIGTIHGGDTGYHISMINIKCWSGMRYNVIDISLWPPMTQME